MRSIVFFFLLAGACTSASRQGRPVSQRERDSLIGASKLPGAQGVRGALKVADSAAARNTRVDSVDP
jgi:hypothetical protein